MDNINIENDKNYTHDDRQPSFLGVQSGATTSDASPLRNIVLFQFQAGSTRQVSLLLRFLLLCFPGRQQADILFVLEAEGGNQPRNVKIACEGHSDIHTLRCVQYSKAHANTHRLYNSIRTYPVHSGTARAPKKKLVEL